MNALQFWTFIIVYFGGLITLNIMVFRWIIINNFVVEVSKDENGVLKHQSYRGRLSKDGNFYSLRQIDFLFIKPKPKYFFDVDFEKNKDKIFANEGLPIIGPKYSVNLIEKGENYVFWDLPDDLNFNSITKNIRIVKIQAMRTDLWISTDNTSKAEFFAQIALPIALVVLAISCLIFFPKMYDKIMEYAGGNIKTAAAGWVDSVKNVVRPIG